MIAIHWAIRENPGFLSFPRSSLALSKLWQSWCAQFPSGEMMASRVLRPSEELICVIVMGMLLSLEVMEMREDRGRFWH